MPDAPDAMDDEIVAEFLVESRENLEQLDRDLVALESAPNDRDLLAAVFRTLHTIKGTSAFLGFGQLERIAHSGESLLAKLRDGLLRLDEAMTTALLAVVDEIRDLLEVIESTGAEDARDHDALIAELERLQVAEAQSAAPVAKRKPQLKSKLPTSPVQAAADVVADAGSADASSADAATAVPTSLEGRDDGEVVSAEVHAAIPVEVAAEPAPEQAAPADHATAIAPVISISAAPDASVANPTETPVHEPKAVAETSIRVSVDLLDTIVRQIGELVLARNQITSASTTGAGDDAAQAIGRLSPIVSELQENVMKTRMQPVEQLWSKLPRVVRDLAKQFGKEIRLVLDGGETELDRSVLEAVKDPLMHLVRNAVDHGIELPDVREAGSKHREGVISLRAFHEGGQVVIEMTDDGGGIDPAKVAAKALEKGILSQSELESLPPREVLALIFRPGFSTADKVTNISGRGVGMDVVKTNIEQIGGTVDLQSAPGAGTTFRIRIPLTLAIIPALLIECFGERFAIPQNAVREVVRLEGESLDALERIGATEVFRLRGQLLPLVRLERCFDPEAQIDAADAVEIVVLHDDDVTFGLAVGRVFEAQEIVVKPLDRRFKSQRFLAGATILGDGSVALIVDVSGLAHHAQLHVESSGHSFADIEGEASIAGSDQFLVVGAGDRRAAFPLAFVSRIEQIPRADVEIAGASEVVQYRGRLLPLVRLGDLLGTPARVDGAAGRIDVVVCEHDGQSIGVMVDAVFDVSAQHGEVVAEATVSGLLGSVILGDRVTELIDVENLCASNELVATREAA